MSFWHSLTGRLFRLVFSAYVFLTLAITAVQLGLEYQSVNRTISRDLAALNESFRDSLTKALWELDHTQMNVMATGLLQSAIVTGVSISSTKGKYVISAGNTPTSGPDSSTLLMAPFQVNTLPLTFMTSTGMQELGTLTLYSDRSVVLDRIEHSFYAILINSMIKTLGLWLIFYFVITRMLTRPLSRMTAVVSRLELAAASPETVSLDYPHHDELGRLMQAMNTMQKRLDVAGKALKDINQSLEETVTERTRQLSEALNFNRHLLLNSPLPMGVFVSDGRCILANESLSNLLNLPLDALVVRNFMRVEHWRKTGLFDLGLAALSDQKPRQSQVHIERSSGRDLWLDCHLMPVRVQDEQCLLVQFIDQTEQHRLESELRNLAFYDALTQLPNRRLLQDRLTQALRNSERNDSYGAVLFLDLNRFKQLNDAHGHDAGDQLLVEVARRLKQTLREVDTVARLGGDEFVVLLEALGPGPSPAAEYAAVVSDKIHHALHVEFVRGDMRCNITTSIGIRLFLGDSDDPDLIIKDADRAMYDIKKCLSR